MIAVKFRLNYFTSLLVALLLISLSNCKFLQKTADKAKALSQCKFELKKVDKKVSFTQNVGNVWNYVITAHIAGINPTKEQIGLGRYSLKLFANDKWVTDINSPSSIILIPENTTDIQIKAIIAPNGAWEIFWKKLWNKKIEYRIQGTFYLRLGTFTYPFAIDLVRWEDNPN